LSPPNISKNAKKCTFESGWKGAKRKKKNLETVATQRFQGFFLLARPKGLEPPTFRTGSSSVKSMHPLWLYVYRLL
jgi:hypothetical protein